MRGDQGHWTFVARVRRAMTAPLWVCIEHQKRKYARRERRRQATWIAREAVADAVHPHPEEIAQLITDMDSIDEPRRSWLSRHVRSECVDCGQLFLRFIAAYTHTDGPR